jgi:hypothetical protein
MSRIEAASNVAEYLSDHFGGAEAAIELLDRLIRHEGADPDSWYVTLRAELDLDRTVLRGLVESFGATAAAPLKAASAWLAEKLTRPKLDLVDDESMGLFLSHEILALGVLGKRSLWEALRSVSADDPRLAGIDFDMLVRRACLQHEQIEARRLLLAARALASHPELRATS